MRTKPIFLFACTIKPEEAWDLVHYLRTLAQESGAYPLTDFQRCAEIVDAQRITGTTIGSGIKQ